MKGFNRDFGIEWGNATLWVSIGADSRLVALGAIMLAGRSARGGSLPRSKPPKNTAFPEEMGNNLSSGSFSSPMAALLHILRLDRMLSHQVLTRTTGQCKILACGYINAQGPQQISTKGSVVIWIVFEASGITV